ncbi:MAG: efflux RND transporter periplasmic adaptor subunit [Gammaproteobacteria bacterium]|nr:efflux RND transporter periplasmic adaptor subunit [Gammaproteobacteria bacterium]MDH3750506.1 efflux RND transporter periplasmic adaptor subunit [Gammaproteobacteria bacterium]
MRLLQLFALLTVCLVAGASAGAQQMPPTIVIVEDAGMKMLAPTIDVPGTVVSRFDSRLASELSAKLKWIADVGTVVKEGDIIASLDDITFQLLEMEAKSRVDREQARVTFLRAEKSRLERLDEDNLSAKSQLEQTTSNLAIAESDQAIAEAQLGQAKVAMYITRIRAPFDGIVTEKLRNIGERLNVADEVIRLVDPNSIEVVARAPLNTVNFIKNEDVLEIYNDYRKGQGSVRTTVPFGNPQSHMFEVRLNVDPSLWTVGESVRLSMPTAPAREVMAVPRDALVLRREGTSVFRIKDDMTAEQVSVITGLGAGSLIEVIGDVKPNDRIVIRGAERLSTGMTVDIRDDGDAGPAVNSLH